LFYPNGTNITFESTGSFNLGDTAGLYFSNKYFNYQNILNVSEGNLSTIIIHYQETNYTALLNESNTNIFKLNISEIPGNYWSSISATLNETGNYLNASNLSGTYAVLLLKTGLCTIGQNSTKILYKPDFSGGATSAYLVYPVGQTSVYGILECTNNAGITKNLTLYASQNYTGVDTICSVDYFNASILNVTTDHNVLYLDLPDGNSTQVWCYRNYTSIPVTKVNVDLRLDFVG
jgi:hypothetical protein